MKACIYQDANGTEHDATITREHEGGVADLRVPLSAGMKRNGADFFTVEHCRKGTARGQWREVAAKAGARNSKREAGAVVPSQKPEDEGKVQTPGDAVK